MAQGSWRSALGTLAENPLAEAFELTRRRRLARVPFLRRYGVALAAVVLFATGAIYVILDPRLSGSQPTATEWPWIALLILGIPLYCIWLLRSVYELALLSLQLLGSHGRRAAHLQLDDMLALTPLTGAEMVLATAWSVLKPMLPVVVSGALLIWALGLGITLDFGGESGDYSRMFSVLAAAPLTTLCILLSSALAVCTLSMWWVALGRGLKADQLSVGGAIIYGLLQAIWIPLAFAMEQNGPFTPAVGYGFEPLNQLALTIVAAALVVGSLYFLLSATENRSVIRAGLAAVGPLLPLLLGFAFVAALLSATEFSQYNVFYEHDMFEAFLPNLALSWSGLMPVNPLAVPHPALLGFVINNDASVYGSPQHLWPTPMHFAGLIVLQGVLLCVCANAATRSVELRRRAI
jgi:hypothetical protein